MTSTRNIGRLAGALAFAVTTGCTALLGVNDVFYDPDGPVAEGDGGASSSSSSSGGGDSSSPADAAACGDADLQTNKDHCGRCDHSCGGGDCVDGKCEAVTIADVSRATGIATDGTYIYASSYTDDAVVRIEKMPGRPVTPFMTNIPRPMGIAIEPPQVYVASSQFASSDGGVHSCELPDCTKRSRFAEIDLSRYVAISTAYVFVSSQSGITRVKRLADAGGPQEALIANYTQCYAVAADDKHVYIGSFNPNLIRLDHLGEAETAMGPRDATTNYGFIALHGDRVFWAYEDNATKKGVVMSAVREAPTIRTTYTTEGVDSAGIAADAERVYWADGGQRSGSDPVGDGTVNTCPRAGCPPSGPTVLATGLRGAGQIVLDDDFVYWFENGTSSADGRVRKVAKP